MAIDLTLSVNPLGCSPRIAKMLKKLQPNDVSQYPDSDPLVDKLAKRFVVEPKNILLGNGSEQLIKLICQTFLKAEDVVRIEEGSFGMFTKEALLAGGNVQLCSLTDIAKLPARLIFVANPKTPTGELIDQNIIKMIQKRNIDDIIVIDEANGELINESSIALAMKSKNMLILRTLSKTFGLAGLRVGIVIGPTGLINTLKKVQQPFPVSQIAVKLALEALGDGIFIQKTKKFISDERRFIQRELSKRGIPFSNSVTNNLFLTFPQNDLIINELAKRGVSVINGEFFPGMKTSGFRVSIKDRKTNRLFLKKLAESIACLKSKNLLPSKEVL